MELPPFPSSLTPFSPASQEILAVAAQVAKNLGSGCVGSAHLALAVLEAVPDNEILAYLLAKNGVKAEEAALYARSQIENDPRGDQNAPLLTQNGRRALEIAATESNMMAQRAVAPEAIFLGLLAKQRGAHIGQVLRPLGLDFKGFRRDWRALLAAQNPYGLDHPLGRLDDAGAEILKIAQEIARKNGSGRINSGHLLLALCEHPEGVYWLEAGGLEIEKVRQQTRENLVSDGEIIEARAKFDASARAALNRALDYAMSAGKIGPRLLLLGLLAPDSDDEIGPNDVAARLMAPRADEIRLGAFDFGKPAQKQRAPDDWPLSQSLLLGLTLGHYVLGKLIWAVAPHGDLSPILLLFFVPAMATALFSRLFGWSKLHFNALLSVACAAILLFLTAGV